MEKWLGYILVVFICPPATPQNVDNITEVHLLVHPQSVVVNIGEKVRLSCKFNAEVSCCWWHESNKSVSSTANVKFKEKSDDCSLTINSVNNTLAGEWHCSSKGTSEVLSVKSKPARISFNDEIITIKMSPTDGHVQLGKTVALHCQFHRRVDCVWKRNGLRVLIRGRYHFQSGNGSKSEECSIKLTKFLELDVGEWTCTCLADSDINRTPYAIAVLSNITQDQQTTHTIMLMIIGILILLLFLIVFGVICVVVFKGRKH